MSLTKSQVRQDMKTRRAAMSAQEVGLASDAMRVRLLRSKLVLNSTSIFCFVSIGNEPDTRNLIHDLLDMDKQVCVPRLNADGQMQAHHIQSLDDLEASGGEYFHIPVPPGDAPVEPKPNITIVPGLAFTQSGLRLGMGGAYYDRYLASCPDTIPIGLCYDWQVLESIPSESHDQPVQMLVTEQRVIRV